MKPGSTSLIGCRLFVTHVAQACAWSPPHKARVAAVRIGYLSGRASDFDAGKMIETLPVRGDHSPASRPCGSGDDEVVGTSRASGFADRDQQFGVHAGNCEVVADDRQAVDDVIEELAPRTSTFAGRDLDSHAEFGDGDRGNGGPVVVIDQVVQVERCAFGLDEDVGVQQEQRQNRSSVVSWSRNATSSPLQSVSTRWRRRSAFASAPVAAIAGSS